MSKTLLFRGDIRQPGTLVGIYFGPLEPHGEVGVNPLGNFFRSHGENSLSIFLDKECAKAVPFKSLPRRGQGWFKLADSVYSIYWGP